MVHANNNASHSSVGQVQNSVMKSLSDGREITECVCANPGQRTETLGEAASGLFENAFSISSQQGGAHVPQQDVSHGSNHAGQPFVSVTNVYVGPTSVCNNSDAQLHA
jgi:hypothetical protein